MNQQQKQKYNNENEGKYYFAPFTEARANLRKIWGTTRKNWDSFLYDQEKKYQEQKLQKDKLPTIAMYSKYLQMASFKFNLQIDECRSKFGLYTENQWQELFNN